MAAPDSGRVRRAWRTTSGVEVPGPGVRGAEGKEKGKGVVVRRGLEEAQSKDAGDEQEPDMRCGTSGASWHVTVKPSIRAWGVLYKSGVYALKVVCLTPGGLHGVRQEADWARSDPSRSPCRSQQRA